MTQHRTAYAPDTDKARAALDEYDRRLLDAAVTRLAADPFGPDTMTYPGRGNNDFRTAVVYGLAFTYVVTRATKPPVITITAFDL